VLEVVRTKIESMGRWPVGSIGMSRRRKLFLRRGAVVLRRGWVVVVSDLVKGIAYHKLPRCSIDGTTIRFVFRERERERRLGFENGDGCL
jgi:hypothetical protein